MNKKIDHLECVYHKVDGLIVDYIGSLSFQP